MSGAGRSRVALLLLLTFAAGIAGGVALERLWLGGEAVADVPDRSRADGEDRDGRRRGAGETVIQRFADELGLTPEQRRRIDPIVEDFYASMHELSKEVRPRFDAVVDSARTAIEEVLTPEQAATYRELLDEHLNRRRGRGRRDGEPSGGSEEQRRPAGTADP